MYNVVDLFCGSGGFSEGFKKEGFNMLLGVDNEHHKEITYRSNIKPKYFQKTDISNLPGWKIREVVKNAPIDVLIGSPPCRDFSPSIRGRCFTLTPTNVRKSLPEHFMRLVVALEPTWFVMENVESYFKTIDGEFLARAIRPYGYHVKLHVLNAVNFGVPQSRVRGFLIGNNLGIKLNFDQVPNEPVTLEDAIGDLVGMESSTDIEIQLPKPITEYQRSRRCVGNKVWNHYPTKHREDVIAKLEETSPGKSWAGTTSFQTEGSKFSGAYYRPHYDRPSRTITSRYDVPTGDGESVHPLLNRCFTPREAARIQSFDDSFKFYGGKVELRLQIGDAVPPLVSQAIARTIRLHMDS
ncbi:DNA cytosine methyltransferase [Paenibacillus sp. sgz302251]|uniref:DNA cytosine methyltransferase n=1 Tax=Paenibacillus sp. sgz302251 TaxID=3414493 RepID=UPI003C7AF247